MKRGLSFSHGRSRHRPHRLSDPRPVAQPERIGIAKGLTRHRVAGGGTPVSPHEHIPQEVDAVELIDPDQAAEVIVLRHIDERQRAEVVSHQGDVRREAGKRGVDSQSRR